MIKSLLLCAASLHSLMITGFLDVQVRKITTDNLEKERIVFKKCWHSLYKNYSLYQLGLSDLSGFLTDIFDQEESCYRARSSKQLFFHAIYNNEVVGYVSFDIRDNSSDKAFNAAENHFLLKNGTVEAARSTTLKRIVEDLAHGHSIYIRQIAVLPDFCTMNVLQDILYVIFDHVLHISCIHVRLPEQAVELQKKIKDLGFVEQQKKMTEIQDRSVFFKLQCNKCGTCMCDLDYLDLGDDGRDDLEGFAEEALEKWDFEETEGSSEF